MKRNRIILLLAAVMQMPVLLQAQIEPLRKNTRPAAQEQTLNTSVPFGIAQKEKIAAIVKPAWLKLEPLLKGEGAETYQQWTNAVNQAASLKDDKTKNAYLLKLKEQYYPFFRRMWDKAGIDEAPLKEKIKMVFDAADRETIEFGEFLNFSIGHRTRKPDAPPPTTAPTCTDVMPLVFTQKIRKGGGAGHADVSEFTGSMYAESGAYIAGDFFSLNVLDAAIKFPGTLAYDNRMVVITKGYTWKCTLIASNSGGIVGFAAAGHGVNNDGYTEYLSAWVPLIFINTLQRDNLSFYVTDKLSKDDLSKVQFGVKVAAAAFAEPMAVCTAFASVRTIRWTICDDLGPDEHH